MKVFLYSIIVLSYSYHLKKPISIENENNSIVNKEVKKEYYGKVIFHKEPNDCQWLIELKDGTELLPVKWPEEVKKKGQKIKLSYRLSRAPQPPCFKGMMIVIEDYVLLK